MTGNRWSRLMSRFFKATARRCSCPLHVPIAFLNMLELVFGIDVMEHTYNDLRASLPRKDAYLPDELAVLVNYENRFTLSVESLAFLYRSLITRKPKRVCEFGSGLSTVVIGYYCKQNHLAPVVCFEHDESFACKTRDLLSEFGLSHYAQILPYSKHFPLVHPFSAGEVDLVFIDGPPKTVGRDQTLPQSSEFLKPGAKVFLDDGFRKHERECYSRWSRLRLVTQGHLIFLPHGLISAKFIGKSLASCSNTSHT